MKRFHHPLFSLFHTIFKGKTKISLKSLTKSKLVIYDKIGADKLVEYLNITEEYSILHVRFEVLHLNTLVLFNFFKFLFRGASLRQSYEAACIKCMSPKMVITYIDNNIFFVNMQHYVSARFIAFQNGLRSSNELIGINEMPDYYCFGKKTLETFWAEKILIKNFKIIGSLRSNFFFSNNQKHEKKFDICIISSYQEGMETSGYTQPINDRKLLTEGTARICSFVSLYLDQHPDLKVCVAMWSNGEQGKLERSFFYSFFKDRATYIENEKFSSYEACCSSEISISYHSTMSFEMMSQGFKSMIFNDPREQIYTLGQTGCDYLDTKSIHYSEFKQKLDWALKCDKLEFHALIKQYINEVITPDVPLDSIRKTFNSILSSTAP